MAEETSNTHTSGSRDEAIHGEGHWTELGNGTEQVHFEDENPPPTTANMGQ